jgi:hypothetical protein
MFGLLPGAAVTAAGEVAPSGWYAGDMHVHRSCGGAPESLTNIYQTMVSQDLSVISLLADMGNGEVKNPVTDLPLVTGADDPVSTAGRIVHWDTEWHWDAIYSQYPHQALGGHIVALGLTNAYQIWSEYTYPIFDWAHKQGGIGGFAHFEYLDDSFPTTLTCCTPIEYPVEVALGACDFISEDVTSLSGHDYFIHAYYRLLNCGFRPGLAAGSDYPCGSVIGPILTYSQVAGGQLTYSNWIHAIAAGRTMVSLNGRNEFVDLVVNGTATPGDEVQLSVPGSVPVTVTWTAQTSLTGTLELVCNGVVVASQLATAGSGSPVTLSTTVNFPRSGWLCARRMDPSSGHQAHTAAVFVTVNHAPVRANAADAQFYVQWMDNLLANTSPGGVWDSYFPTSLTAAQARYSAARAVYAQIAAEAESLVLNTKSLPNGLTNAPYTARLTAVGGTAPYNAWTIVSGAMPPGLTLDAASGAITGTPTTAGLFNFVAGVGDSSDPRQTATQPLSITITKDIYGNGPGGPILVLANTTNHFSSYCAEILLAEGLNEFALKDISSVNSTALASYDVILLGETVLTPGQVTMLTDWVNAGGNLIAMRPDKQLAGLLGLTDALGTITNAYLLVDTSSGPGGGIVGQTIQFHGVADQYTLNGATGLATLYSDAQTSAGNPAVTLRSVGSGQAAAFTFDLARSVVYTRQGNPAWSGEPRDGALDQTVDGEPGVIRAVDLFYGAASFDPQPDWVDLNKVAIPQADEQQRLLANLMICMEANKKPLPRFWYFPHGYKAVVVMTGDDHAGTYGGSYASSRFDEYLAASPAVGSVDDWTVPRCTAYIFVSPNPSLTSDTQAAAYDAAGFEIGLHLNTGCANYTGPSLDAFFTDQMGKFTTMYPSLPFQTTHRIHCIAWSDYSTPASVSYAHGIRLDTSYYYWPAAWVADRPGLFTGSGMPMRFATAEGDVLDVYQATTQMTDESVQSYPDTVDALLDRALGPEGYYGAFVANMHTDTYPEQQADAIFSSATNHGAPIISARQLLTWLDARNGSSIGSITWTNGKETFSVQASASARGLQTMVPVPVGSTVSGVNYNGNPITYKVTWIKGIQYAVFTALTGNYETSFAVDATPPGVNATLPVNGASMVDVAANVHVAFSKAMDVATINTDTITLRNPSGGLVTATVTYNPVAYTAILTPTAPLALATTYTATIRGGVGGVTDLGGSALLNSFVWSFTTVAQIPSTIWPNTALPSLVDVHDDQSVELGVKFRSDLAGSITGVRFYKSSANTGTHVGSLWTSTGTLLASATFTGETDSGWQQVLFTTPVAITPNTVYVASYHANNGHYSADDYYFSDQGKDNYPLHALTDGESGGDGVYNYGTISVFPEDTWHAANYWVDVVFERPVLTVTITAGITADSKVYDGGTNATISSNNVVLSGVLPADVGQLELSTNGYVATFASAEAGPGIEVTVTGLSLTGAKAGGYVLTQPTGLTAAIEKATPTVTLAVNNSPVAYNGTAQAASVGITVGSVPGAVANILTGGASSQTDAGTYVVTADFVPTDGANYNRLLGQAAGNFVIGKATPTATLAVNNSPVTYNGTAQAASVRITANSVPGAVANILTGSTSSQTDPGIYAVTANFVPTDAANYNSLLGQAAGDFVIEKRPVTITSGITADNKVYDGGTGATISSNIVMLSGVLAADVGQVDLSTNGYVALFVSADVGGNVGVTVSGLSLTGAKAVDYSLTAPVGLTAKIAQAAVTITSGITGNDKVYDGGTGATISSNYVVLSGLLAADAGQVDLSTNEYVAKFTGAGAGLGIGVTVDGLSLTGDKAEDYLLTAPAGLTADITALGITGAFTTQSKIYDGNNSAVVLASDLNGILPADVGNVSLHGGTATFADAQAGTGKTVTLTGADLIGEAAANYSLTSVATKTADITARGITGSFTAKSRVYDGSDLAVVLTRTLSGVLLADQDNVSLDGGTATFADTQAAPDKTVTLAGATLTGGAAGNYLLNSVTTTTADISPAPLTVTANDASKLYGTTLTFAGTEFTTSGLVSTDTVTSVTLTSEGAVAGAEVGTYDITPSAAEGSGLDNYTINYVNGALTVLPVVSVSGTVAYYPASYPASGLSATRVGNVTMSLTGGTTLTTNTLADGSYLLPNIPVGGTYSVTPSKTDDSDAADGVTVADLGKLQAYLLSKLTLDPYQLLAADVNANGSLTVSDLGLIQALILNKRTNFPAGLWRFVPANYVFPDPANPWNAPSQRWYTNLVADVADGDFIAIKLGDVNNSWKAPAGGRSLVLKSPKGGAALAAAVPEVLFGVGQQSAQPGQTVTVEVTVSGFRQVTSAQFSLAWDPAVLRYVGTGSYGVRGLSAGCYGTSLSETGKLAFAWYDPEVDGVTLADGTVLFTVSFEVIGKAGSVSALALAGSPTAQEVCVDLALAAFGAQDGNVSVVGPGVLVSTLAYANGVFRLSVPTEQERSYVLEFTEALTPANWTALTAVTGDGTVKVLVDPAATNQQRFYRIHVQ